MDSEYLLLMIIKESCYTTYVGGSLKQNSCIEKLPLAN